MGFIDSKWAYGILNQFHNTLTNKEFYEEFRRHQNRREPCQLPIRFDIGHFRDVVMRDWENRIGGKITLPLAQRVFNSMLVGEVKKQANVNTEEELLRYVARRMAG